MAVMQQYAYHIGVFIIVYFVQVSDKQIYPGLEFPVFISEFNYVNGVKYGNKTERSNFRIIDRLKVKRQSKKIDAATAQVQFTRGE